MTRTWSFSAGRASYLWPCERLLACLLVERFFLFLFNSFSVLPLPNISTATASGMLNMSLLKKFKNKAFFLLISTRPARALPTEQFSIGLQLDSHMKRWSGLCGATPPGTPLARDVTPHAAWLRSRPLANGSIVCSGEVYKYILTPFQTEPSAKSKNPYYPTK